MTASAWMGSGGSSRKQTQKTASEGSSSPTLVLGGRDERYVQGLSVTGIGQGWAGGSHSKSMRPCLALEVLHDLLSYSSAFYSNETRRSTKPESGPSPSFPSSRFLPHKAFGMEVSSPHLEPRGSPTVAAFKL